MKAPYLVLALIALTGASVTLPSSWSWTSSSKLVDVKTDSSHTTVHSIKDPTIAYYNGVYHVYATIHTPSGWNMVYFNFTSFDKASSAKWYYMDKTSGFSGYKCAPELFYMSTKKLWYLVFQSPYPTYSTNSNPGNPAGWSSPKYFFTTMPSNAIDFFPICDDTTCYLFFSNDGGYWYRTSTPKTSFPSGWSKTFTTVLKSASTTTYFEGSWVHRLTTQKLYIAGIEGIDSSGKRYYQAFTSSSLGGSFTTLASGFATKSNVKFSGTAWSSGVSHGELVRSNYDETWQVNPCSIKFFYQGLSSSASGDYGKLPYKLGLLTSSTSITGCSSSKSAAPITCSLNSSTIEGAASLGSCSSTVLSGSSCSLSCNTGYVSNAGTCSSGTWSPAPNCSIGCSLSSLPTGASSTGTCSPAAADSTCVLSCSTGYTAVSGVCSASGIWSTTPSCSANSCTLSSTLPTGASDMGTCATTVSSGSTCKYTCSSSYIAVAGRCSTGFWTVSPSCSATTPSSTCSLSSLPSGATGWGTCSSSVAAGSSCKLACNTSSVSGYCSSSGSWSTVPSCSSSCTAKSCGSRTCGLFWNGCAAVSCGSCPSGSTCDGSTCLTENTSADWTQVAPDSFTSLNWAAEDDVLTLTNTSLPSLQRIIAYKGSRTSWFSDTHTVATIMVKASEGSVGLGLRLGQGLDRATDRIGWLVAVDGSNASTQYCATSAGVESCVAGASSVAWSASGFNNLTISITVGPNYITSQAWLNNASLASTPFASSLSNFWRTGSLFLSTKGSASKSFTNLVVRSKSSIHIALYQCMSASAWKEFVANLLGVSSSHVTTTGTASALCSTSRKRAATGAEELFTEFDTTLADSLETSTRSSALVNVLQDAVSDGAASWAGFDMASVEMVLPVTSGILVGADAAAAATAGLSAGAIAAIAVGSAVAVAGVGAAATAAVVVVAKRQKSSGKDDAVAVPMEKKPSVVRSGLDVMNMSGGEVHSSITARAAPVAV